jgi:hypothetical protein
MMRTPRRTIRRNTPTASPGNDYVESRGIDPHTMNPLTRLPLLLAQDAPDAPAPGGPTLERFSQISENFTSRELISPHWLLIAVGAMLLLLSALSIARWWKHRNEYARPLRVFMAAANMAGLGYADRWLLLLIARRRSLESPLTLILSPGTFDHHNKAYLDGRRWRREAVRRRSQSIRESLFGDLPTHHEAQASGHR